MLFATKISESYEFDIHYGMKCHEEELILLL